MLTLTPRTRVTELRQGPPALMKALVSTGLFREGDDPDVMLGELCWTFGFNPGILLTMLESANVPERVPPIDTAPYLAMPLVEFVDHLEKTHHAYLREALPRMTALAGTVAEAAPGDATLEELRDELLHLAAELDQHLAHEEEALFPMVRDIETRGVITPTRCGGSLGGPIACMENEHAMAEDALAKIRGLTAGRAPGPPRLDELIEKLRVLDRDLQVHMYKEDEVLFPRALDAQRSKVAAPAT